MLRDVSLLFFFNETAPTKIYTYGHTLSLHDALPIYRGGLTYGSSETAGVDVDGHHGALQALLREGVAGGLGGRGVGVALAARQGCRSGCFLGGLLNGLAGDRHPAGEDDHRQNQQKRRSQADQLQRSTPDRKSTRLNSSH